MSPVSTAREVLVYEARSARSEPLTSQSHRAKHRAHNIVVRGGTSLRFLLCSSITLTAAVSYSWLLFYTFLVISDIILKAKFDQRRSHPASTSPRSQGRQRQGMKLLVLYTFKDQLPGIHACLHMDKPQEVYAESPRMLAVPQMRVSIVPESA